LIPGRCESAAGSKGTTGLFIGLGLPFFIEYDKAGENLKVFPE
jgi:hypothetical protein